jgi:hypothetical protein
MGQRNRPHRQRRPDLPIAAEGDSLALWCVGRARATFSEEAIGAATSPAQQHVVVSGDG